MSIYIKDMEMPVPGRYEAVIIVLDESTAEIAISPAEDDIGYWKEYPLFSVPEHGRLIDADELPVSRAVPLDGKPYKYVHIDNISTAPTIILADKEE